MLEDLEIFNFEDVNSIDEALRKAGGLVPSISGAIVARIPDPGVRIVERLQFD